MNDRIVKREKTWSRAYLAPLLEAERDRDRVRRLDAYQKIEAEIMSDVPNWSPLDLKAPVQGLGKDGIFDPNACEPVYHTKRYVDPTLYFIPPEHKIPVESLRASSILFKVGSFFVHHRILLIMNDKILQKKIQSEHDNTIECECQMLLTRVESSLRKTIK